MNETPEISAINDSIDDLANFIRRLVKLAKPSVVAFLSALFILHRLSREHYFPKGFGTPGFAAKMFLTALMISVKYFDCHVNGRMSENGFSKWVQFGDNRVFITDLLRMEQNILLHWDLSLQITASDLEIFAETVLLKSYSEVPEASSMNWILKFMDEEEDLQIVPASKHSDLAEIHSQC